MTDSFVLPFDCPTFWKKVDFDGPTQAHMDTNCWIWTAAANPRYGLFNPPNYGKKTGAHRFSWSQANNVTIPEGYDVDHLCLTPLCVRPEHLEAVTRLENSRRRTTRITHCPKGHEYTDENTYVASNNCRSCITCHREREAERRA